MDSLNEVRKYTKGKKVSKKDINIAIKIALEEGVRIDPASILNEYIGKRIFVPPYIKGKRYRW